jgi:sugar O-acyltransferase (sialic acid O-acetyltransferase NeuD family)
MIEILKIPQDNPNDEFVKILNVISNETLIQPNTTVIIEYETTKSLIEHVLNIEGYFYTDIKPEDKLKVGYEYGIISGTKLNQSEWQTILENSRISNSLIDNFSKYTITKPAKELIEKYKIPINYFEGKKIITREDCENYINNGSNKFWYKNIRQELREKYTKIAIIGAGTGAAIVTDILSYSNEYRISCFYDDQLVDSELFGIKVKNKISIDDIVADFKNNIFDAAIVTLGSQPKLRDDIFNSLEELGVKFINAIHPSTIIAKGVELGYGNVIAANSVIGVYANLGKNNFISSSCVIEHHNILGKSISFGPGVQTSGTVKINDRVKFGTGIFIEPYLEIGSDSVISSGSIITRNIPENHIVKFISNIKIIPNNI